MLDKTFVPVKPFSNFKWQWACLTCTEGLNDPVVLLGVLQRMYKLERSHLHFSSSEFAHEMDDLTKDVVNAGLNVDLRSGSRNLIRNSGQYWKAVRLIPKETHGMIELTDFGREVASHQISQAEFAAVTIQTLTLPNTAIMSPAICRDWTSHGLFLTPLKLLLQVIYELNRRSPEQGYIQPIELQKIIVPLSGTRGVTVNDYVNFIMWNRNKEINIDRWPNCCEGANDHRMAREFLLFLTNYGYLLQHKYEGNAFEHYSINHELVDEIYQIISTHNETDDINRVLQVMRESQVISEVERKRVRQTVSRPNQAHFRRDVLAACRCCVITNAEMPEILEAAHVKPFKYNGEDTIANGFAMRVDIHTLFDTGHLRISPDGDIDLSPKARNDYGSAFPKKIFLPDFTNRDFLRWRWENYDGL